MVWPKVSVAPKAVMSVTPAPVLMIVSAHVVEEIANPRNANARIVKLPARLCGMIVLLCVPDQFYEDAAGIAMKFRVVEWESALIRRHPRWSWLSTGRCQSHWV